MKNVKDSQVIMHELVLPNDTNILGNILGGKVMHSMEVGVRVESENPINGNKKHTASAYLTFVSLDKDNKPKKVQDVKPESKEEKRRFNDGKLRYLNRKKRRSNY